MSFMLLDFVKVFVYRHWNFELTAKLWPSKYRRDRVKLMKGRKIIKARIDANFAKVRKQIKMIYAVRAFEEGLKKNGKSAATIVDKEKKISQ